MAGVISTANHPKALWPGVKAWFGRSYNDHMREYPDMFDIEQSTQHFEDDVELSGFPLAPVKDEGAGTTYASLTQGYTARYTHVAYALGYIVTEEEIDDNLYESVSNKRAPALARSLVQTRETTGANIYNRGFNSAYTGGDGKELLATDHPSRAGTWQNELTTPADLSEAALEDICILLMNAVDNDGLRINLMPKKLIVPPALYFEACRILKSILRVDTANNDPNALREMNVIPGSKMCHYLTSTTAWFLRTDAPRGLIHYERKIKDFERDNDFNTGNALAKKYERYSYGWTDPRGLYGSAGA